MGTFIYDSALRIPVEDRTLEHVRFVIFAKLRARESFAFTIVQGSASRATRSTSLWVSPEIPLGFEFSGPAHEELSASWLDALMKMSYRSSGLVISSESRAAAPAGSL